MDSYLGPYLWLIPALPLAAAALITFLGPRLLRQHSHWPCVLAIFGSFLVSAAVFEAVYLNTPTHKEGRSEIHEGDKHKEETKPEIKQYYDWIKVGKEGATGSVNIGFTLRADPLSAVMLVMITLIGTLIAVYSVGYMHDDAGYPRFFAEVALFIFMMTTLVLADNFVLMFLGWEGVGLCSYLLIGFWFTKPEAADAARKAFLVTRIGDVGLFLGVLLLWITFDYHLDYSHILNPEIIKQLDATDHTVLVVACLLLFCGACGKSAQFPLHVWLPDAMEGPTPVSALIHAATMVTAGVYLVARCTPLFVVAPEAQVVVACVGGFTALFAAVIALTQNDLKRVLAYSTLSQLGYMFLALGSGIGDLATLAVIAAMFHLFTHAFFKALLFMGAGSVMHAMGGIIDMRRFGGLQKLMPTTRWTFLCGALALAGFPLLSGFWSKDEILSAAWHAQETQYGTLYLILWIAGTFTAGLTGFYTFRAYFLTFHGDERIPEEAGHHAHESPRVMTVPLMILAVFAVGIGGVLALSGFFVHFLETTPGFPAAGEHSYLKTETLVLMAVSSVVALAGIGLAYWMYEVQPATSQKLADAVPVAYQTSLNKVYIDELYDLIIIKPLRLLANIARIFDRYIVDGLVDLVGYVCLGIGFLFRPIQNGLVQFYALAMVMGLIVFIVALVRAVQ